MREKRLITVTDPDPEIRKGTGLKKFFSALRASVLTKNKGKPQPPRTPPLDPPLDTSIRTDGFYEINRITFVIQSIFVDKERE